MTNSVKNNRFNIKTEMDIESLIASISDPLIRDGMRLAVFQTLIPAATEEAYPGHFTVTADGKWYGPENTWPGLDSWELAGAYLFLGRQRLVRDYFAFVRASQREDGNIPFAISPGETEPSSEARETYRRGERWPEDVYEYTPLGCDRTRKWIGLYDHWQLKARPLSVLGAVSYVLTAADYFADSGDVAWLKDNFSSVEAAARYILSRRDYKRLLGASGFYIESPPRNRWDGIAQCYGVKAFRETAALGRAAGVAAAFIWEKEADSLAEAFRCEFWRGDHFAEYIHYERGLIDLHGLSDVNWAAIAFGIASEYQCRILWPLLLAEPAFWHGGMPTQLVAKPGTYADWELPEALPFVLPNPVHDVAAMGRVWWLEAQACLRMHDFRRLCESVRLVCEMGVRHNGWFERYPVQADGSVKPSGANGYCEYAAILVRIVFGNIELFQAESGMSIK